MVSYHTLYIGLFLINIKTKICQPKPDRFFNILSPADVWKRKREEWKRADLATQVRRTFKQQAHTCTSKPTHPVRPKPTAQVRTRLPGRPGRYRDACGKPRRADKQEHAVGSDTEPGDVRSATHGSPCGGRKCGFIPRGCFLSVAQLCKRPLQ